MSNQSTSDVPNKENKPTNVKADTACHDERDKAELMDVLHKYNDIKDATQKVLGALAMMEGATAKEMHVRYNLPLDS